MAQFVHNLKIVIKTIIVISVIGFISGTFYLYKDQGEKMAANAESVPTKPDFDHSTHQQFIDNIRECVNYIYDTTTDITPVNLELLVAQAALESAWGTSRFAVEGNNYFGIRTYDLREPHMLPSNNPKKWGVKVYKHGCDSVQHYMNILNSGSAFEKYRELKYSGENNPFKLVETLDAYATDVHYFSKVKSIIKKIRKEYS